MCKRVKWGRSVCTETDDNEDDEDDVHVNWIDKKLKCAEEIESFNRREIEEEVDRSILSLLLLMPLFV